MTLVHKVIGDNPNNIISVGYDFPKRYIGITSGTADGSRIGVNLEISRVELRELIDDFISAYKEMDKISLDITLEHLIDL